MSGVNLLVHLTDEQWTAIREVSERHRKDPFDVMAQALRLGWPALMRDLDKVPRPPAVLRLVR